MSTNKTPNYQLHSWLPDDEFHLTEINENFTKLDQELALETEALQDTFADEVTGIKTTLDEKLELIVGSYTANGGNAFDTHIDITLGFQPKAVFVCPSIGVLATAGMAYAGIAAPGYNSDGIDITSNGFTVWTRRSAYLNSSGVFYYIVLL